jgi:hypothetical protein
MSENTEQESNQGIESMREILRKLEEAGAPVCESPAKVVRRLSRYAGTYPERNLAVEVCNHLFAQTADKALKQGDTPNQAKVAGKIAFCAALPKLAGASNIRDFIACVTHGMAMSIIPSNEGTRLLYAAQVAHTARTKRPKKRNKTSHTSTKETAVTSKESTQ